MQITQFLSDKFELVRGGSAGNLRAMEGTRGFAVFLVFLVHYSTMMHPWMTPGSFLEAFGERLHIVGKTGVDLFFILSGYLIYGSLIARQQAFGPFMVRRIRRIYPTFLAVFALYLVLSLFSAADSKIPSGTEPALLYLAQNLLLIPGLQRVEPMIAVTWSLSYEMLFYLVIPLLIAALGLRQRSATVRVLLFALLGGGIVYYSFGGGHIRMIMFVAGIFLWEALRHPRVARFGTAIGALGLGLGMVATQLPIGAGAQVQWQMGILFCAFLAFCYCCYAEPAGALARAFSWTPMRWLGNMSYSFYLLHGVSIKASVLVLSKLLPAATHQHDWVFWCMLPVILAIAMMTSAVLFLAIERPYSLATARKAPAPAHGMTANLPSGQ